MANVVLITKIMAYACVWHKKCGTEYTKSTQLNKTSEFFICWFNLTLV